MYSKSRPILANMAVTRKCNRSCTYCNQYDKVSDPVPAEALERRIDMLADRGCTAITFNGGEPMLHPALDRSSLACARAAC